MKIKIPEENRIFYFIAGVVVAFTILLFVLFPFKGSENKSVADIKPASTVDEFGIVIDSLKKSEEEIKKNETFSKMLVGLGLPQNQALKVIEKTKNDISANQFKAGMKYFTYFAQKDSKELKYLVFHFDIKKSVVITINDSIKVDTRIEKEEVVRRSVGAKIKGSLYETLDALKINDALATELAGIFASQMDFYRLQDGDSFKIIFDETLINGKSYRIGKIYACLFNHRKEDYFAFHFEQGGINDFYDEKANMLKEGYLKAPLKFARISSRFSKNRLHPVLGYSRPHLGTDYAAPTGTPIQSIGDGSVMEKGFNGGFGNYVKIKHNGSYTTQYAHMSKFASGIKKGSKVKKSQVIGYVGSTGLSSGPHVDFRFWKNGKLVDHLKEKYPIASPIDKKYKPAFIAAKDKLYKELVAITMSGNS